MTGSFFLVFTVEDGAFSCTCVVYKCAILICPETRAAGP
jgi:hypothetical protein